ncbi:MAG: SrfA family protein [Desulfovibrio sp.]|jgi:hypothetical protein|nr:SrfA family protein [Desulfovibrio sp.]
MSSTLIATTRRGAYNALRFQGILVTESYAQLAALLEKRLSPRHARFLAEPAHDASGSTTDWYTRTEERVRPIAELPENEKSAALRAVSAVASDIAELAETLKAGPDSSSVIRGNILSLALHYPGEEHLYTAGDQPVLTCWGFDPGSPDVQPEDLVRLGSALPVPKAAASAPGTATPAAPAQESATFAAAPAAARSIAAFPWGALLRLLAGLALALALYFLIALLAGPSGCLPAGQRLGGCAPAPAPAPPAANTAAEAPETDAVLLRGLNAEQEKEASLRRELADLQRRLEARILECPRTPPPPSEPEKKAPEKEEAEVPPPALADLMPVTPDPEPEPPAPQPEPKPEPKPKAPAQKKGEDLKIPEEARKNKDMRFLEGCWNSDSGLVDSSGDPVIVTYCFDDKGNGTRAITRKQRGDRCAGSVRARFDGSGKLLIDADGAACPRGSAFVPHRVECLPGAGGDARCNGRELGGFKNRWNAKFRKN